MHKLFWEKRLFGKKKRLFEEKQVKDVNFIYFFFIKGPNFFNIYLLKKKKECWLYRKEVEKTFFLWEKFHYYYFNFLDRREKH